MITLYKLTDPLSQTYDQTQWGGNVTHELPARDIYQLCSDQVLHAYVSPELAVLMDPVQANLLPSAILWEAEGDVVIDDGTKVGCTRLTTLKQIPIPTVTLEQRVTFAIRCALHVYNEPSWVVWAQAWLTGANRDADAARAASYAAYAANAAANAARAAADAARAAAYYDANAEAEAAAYAANAAAYAAADAASYAADAADAARAAAYAANASYYAKANAAYAANAAANAANANANANVALIAKEVCNV
jgi:hypothetical protein